MLHEPDGPSEDVAAVTREEQLGREFVRSREEHGEEKGFLAGPYRGLPSAVAREASKNMFRIGLFTPLLLALHPPGKHRNGKAGEEVPVRRGSGSWRGV